MELQTYFESDLARDAVELPPLRKADGIVKET